MGKSDIIATMGLDLSEFNKGVASVEKSSAKLGQSLSNNVNVARKGVSQSTYRMGQFGMQIQDVAVQMQNANDKFRAFFVTTAQQAPQFLSIFGPKGAVVGGVVGIGAALGGAVYNSQKNFSEMITHAQEYGDELMTVAKGGGIKELVAGLKEAQKESKILQEEIDGFSANFTGSMNYLSAQIAGLFGGENANERIEKAGEAQAKINEAQATARRRLLDLADKEIEVQKLRQAGQNELADKIQQEIDLQKELARIQASNSDDFVKQKLREIAVQEDKTKTIEREKAKDAEAAEKQKRADEQTKRANDEWVAAVEEGEKMQIAKLSLADRIAIANKKVADAEKQVAKETKGTLGWYREMAKLQQARNDADALFAQRAKDYSKSFATGRRADREREKEAKEQARGERRLREADARKGRAVRGAASGLGDQQKRGDGMPNIQPKPPNVVPQGPQAPNNMVVDTIIAKTIKPA